MAGYIRAVAYYLESQQGYLKKKKEKLNRIPAIFSPLNAQIYAIHSNDGIQSYLFNTSKEKKNEINRNAEKFYTCRLSLECALLRSSAKVRHFIFFIFTFPIKAIANGL